MLRTVTTIAAIALLAPAFAVAQTRPQQPVDRDDTASRQEIRRITREIGRIGCRATKFEKEYSNYEVDDAVCEIGQFDIKLDAQFRITSMTRD